jgi:DNA-binding IclR family transcriptional regulator
MLAKPVYIHYTKNTITTPKLLQREIARVRKLGFGVDDEEEEMAMRCVAVPVFRAGRFAAALSVTGSSAQILIDDLEGIATRLRHSAAAIFPPEQPPGPV